MRRKTPSQIRKEHTFGIMLAVVLLLVGIVLHFAPGYLTAGQQEKLTETTVIAGRIKPVLTLRGPGLQLVTMDGESYVLRGACRADELRRTVVPGTEITVRYRQSQADRLLGHRQAWEVTVNGEAVVRCDTENGLPLLLQDILSGACVLLGAAILYFSVSFMRSEIDQQRKRDRRIIRKYGALTPPKGRRKRR